MTAVAKVVEFSKVNHAKEKRDHKKAMQIQQITESIRDDVIGITINSKLTFKQIEENGGPCEQTLVNWADRKVMQPRLSTVVAALLACGHDPAQLLKQYVK